ncbi:hypothetical protein BFX80_03980 [Cobetia marina]|nr:hypothetical protein BFX80_03980 [Cobetia marina]
MTWQSIFGVFFNDSPLSSDDLDVMKPRSLDGVTGVVHGGLIMIRLNAAGQSITDGSTSRRDSGEG